MIEIIRQRLHSQRGVVIILVVTLLPVMIAFLGMAIDCSMLRYYKEDALNVADCAAAAATQKGFDKDAFRRTGVREFDRRRAQMAAQQYVEMLNQSRKVKFICEVEKIQIKNETITVPVYCDVHPCFMPYFGKQFATVRIHGTSNSALARRIGG